MTTSVPPPPPPPRGSPKMYLHKLLRTWQQQRILARLGVGEGGVCSAQNKFKFSNLKKKTIWKTCPGLQNQYYLNFWECKMIGFWVPERSVCPRWSRVVLISGMPPPPPKGITVHKAPAEFFSFSLLIPAWDQGKSGVFQFVECSTVCRGQILLNNVPSTYTENILPPVLYEGKFVK